MRDGLLIRVIKTKGIKILTKGNFINVKITPCGRYLVIMSHFERVSLFPDLLRFFVFDLVNEKLMDFSSECPIYGKQEPTFCISTVKDNTGSDYLYILVGSTLRIVSLTSGVDVIGAFCPSKKGDSAKLNVISCQSIPTRVAVGSSYSREFYLYNIVNLNMKRNATLFSEFERFRINQTPVENRERYEEYKEGFDSVRICSNIMNKYVDNAFNERFDDI